MTVKEQFAMMYVTGKWQTTRVEDLDIDDVEVYNAYLAGFDKARSLDTKRLNELKEQLDN